MHFVCCVSIPDDEFSVLRSRHEMSSIGGPVHGVNLGQMTLECATRPHSNPRKRVGIIHCNLLHLIDHVSDDIYILIEWRDVVVEIGDNGCEGKRVILSW